MSLNSLENLKNQLLSLEKQFTEKLENCNDNINNTDLDEEAKKILSTKSDEIVRLNVGGKPFLTRIKTLMSHHDTLFYKIILSKQIDLTKEIFFDRSPLFFEEILNFIRFNKINLRKFTTDQLVDLKTEAEYYDILELEKMLEHIAKVKEIINVEVNAYYYEGSNLVGTKDINVLSDPNLNTGICTTFPAWFKVTLNGIHIIEEIEIGGYTGKNDWLNNAGYGAGASVSTSLDGKSWNTVGTLPSGFGQIIMKFKVSRSEAQYIKFEGNVYFGIGYLKFL